MTCCPDSVKISPEEGELQRLPLVECAGVAEMYESHGESDPALAPRPFGHRCGEFRRVSGPSGYGKSTLKRMSGLMLETNGDIIIHWKRVAAKDTAVADRPTFAIKASLLDEVASVNALDEGELTRSSAGAALPSGLPAKTGQTTMAALDGILPPALPGVNEPGEVERGGQADQAEMVSPSAAPGEPAPARVSSKREKVPT